MIIGNWYYLSSDVYLILFIYIVMWIFLSISLYPTHISPIFVLNTGIATFSNNQPSSTIRQEKLSFNELSSTWCLYLIFFFVNFVCFDCWGYWNVFLLKGGGGGGVSDDITWLLTKFVSVGIISTNKFYS